MLQQLHIRNFAIIDDLALDFKKGMTAITGETGAGKSIAIDALGLVLGDRADPSSVKHGEKRSEITASFDISHLSSVKKWLADQELDENDECLLRRTVSAEGGSRAYINSRPVTVLQIKNLSEKLIDIHSQHQHQSLLRQDEQRQLLDNFGKNQSLVKSVATQFSQWNDLNKQLNKLKKSIAERGTRIDFLQYQINEFQELDIGENEWTKLEQEHKQLANAEEIEQALSKSTNILSLDENAVISQLATVIHELEPLSEFIPNIKNCMKSLTSANINIEETANDLKHYINDEKFDNNKFLALDKRLTILLDLSRKHHCDPSELLLIQKKLEDELSPLLNAEEILGNLETEITKARDQYQQEAIKLTTNRKKSALKLKKSCEKILSSLGMNCQLEAQLMEMPINSPNQFGNENILFSISTNPGSPLKPLSKVASGGELSRISLAIQVVTAQVTQIPTLVFDEVDVGIGGGVAEVVGKLLNKLGLEKQIICITHQAQVAAKSDTHWLVEKQISKKQVSTRIIPLHKSEREIEIARMIGGLELTEATHQHAKEMLGTL